jgi:tetratricopeptide (TPR) repeat protein
MDPADEFTRFAIAMEHVNTGRDADALDWFLQILERNERYIGVYYHLGKTLERLNRPDDAVDVYTRGIALARSMNDHHAASELEGALFELR